MEIKTYNRHVIILPIAFYISIYLGNNIAFSSSTNCSIKLMTSIKLIFKNVKIECNYSRAFISLMVF